MKFKKRKKSSRRHAHQTAFRGAKERTRHSGNRGGYGMAGTGKRGDQRKTLILNLPEAYFGKSRTLRKGRVKPKLTPINLSFIQSNIESFVKSKLAKESGKGYELVLKKHKLLADGDISFPIKVTVDAASQAAVEKVKKAGGEVFITSNASEEE